MIVPSTTPMHELVAAYREHGFVQCKNLLGARDLAELREVTRNVILARAAGIQMPFTDDLDMLFNTLCAHDRSLGGDVYRILRQHPVVVRLLVDDRITGIVKHLLDQNGQPLTRDLYVGLDKLHFRIDRKGEGQYSLPWHQDYPYICTTTRGVVAWYCLTDVDPAMGPMRVIPGSHKLGMLPTRIDPNYKVKFDHNRLFSLVGADDSQAIELPAKSGDVIFMSVLTVHASGVNTTDRARWSVVSRYDNLLDPEFAARGWRTGIDGASKTVTVLDTPHAAMIVNRKEILLG